MTNELFDRIDAAAASLYAWRKFRTTRVDVERFERHEEITLVELFGKEAVEAYIREDARREAREMRG